MLNRDRKEVIDALIKWACEPRSFYGVDEFMEEFELDFNADTYDDLRNQIIEWINSRYKPYKITKSEKNVLELISRHYYAIRKDKNGMILLVEKGTHDEVAFPMLKGWFKCIKEYEGIWINQLLAESVVVDE